MFEKLKKKFTQKPVLTVPDLNKKNENGSGCVGLYYKGSIINRRRRWKVETSCLSL